MENSDCTTDAHCWDSKCTTYRAVDEVCKVTGQNICNPLADCDTDKSPPVCTNNFRIGNDNV